MTGTALTEEKEFRDIYGMDVIEIPTNRAGIRERICTMLYTRRRKKSSMRLSDDIKEAHENGQPVLVGTITIEASEELSRMLNREGIPHKVLNAKFHELEAEIVSGCRCARRRDHCHQYGRPWYGYQAGRCSQRSRRI